MHPNFDLENLGPPSIAYPETIIEPSATYLLTETVRTTLGSLIPFLRCHANDNLVGLGDVEITGFQDPDDESDEVVVTLWVGLSADAALRYWDKVGEAIERWPSHLPAPSQSVMIERVMVEVRPIDRTPADS